MLKRYDRYLLRIFWVSYGILLATFIGLFSLVDALNNLDGFLKTKEELQLPLLEIILRHYAVEIPLLYYRAGPFLTLAAVMFTMVQLQRRSELLPMVAAGVSLRRILLPVFGAALLLGLVGAATQELLLPWVGTRAEVVEDDEAALRPGQLPDSQRGLLHVQRYHPRTRALEEITFVQRRSDFTEEALLVADRGHWEEAAGRFRVFGGFQQQVQPDGQLAVDPATGVVAHTPLPEEGVLLPSDLGPLDLEAAAREASYFSFTDLRTQYRRQPYLKHLEVQLQERIAFPLTHLVLLLIGLPFVLHPDRSNVYLGLIVCFVICGVFILSNLFFSYLGGRGELHPAVAAWLPTVFFTLLGFLLFDKAEG